MNNKKFIGPVPVAVKTETVKPQRSLAEADPPFVVNRKSPTQQQLAAKVGWKRLEEIEREEAEAHRLAQDNE